VDAWLTVVRRGGRFDAQTDAVMEALAPRLRSVMRGFVMLERERFTASLAEEAIMRLHFGWLAIDREGRVVDSDRVGEAMLGESGLIGRSPSGRLRVADPQVQRNVLDIVKAMAADPQARPRAVSISSDPWLDMLLVAAPQRLIGSIGKPAVVAYVHGDSWRAADRCLQLMDMFRLTRSEAHLALELCRGRSIAEAAEDLGLQVETMRGYSKSIFAKTGARGQADLVRILMGSVLALASDHGQGFGGAVPAKLPAARPLPKPGARPARRPVSRVG
jgi:DNA-binding CsgD family transcriptional regulator